MKRCVGGCSREYKCQHFCGKCGNELPPERQGPPPTADEMLAALERNRRPSMLCDGVTLELGFAIPNGVPATSSFANIAELAAHYVYQARAKDGG